MKTHLFKIGLRLAVLQLGLLLCQNGWAAVGFSVTPSSVSNTYSGSITLLVTGLNAGDTVLVQKYLDANTNGVIDAGDLLLQQFHLMDGSNFVIGGLTNVNVPGDADTVPGQITAKLSFQSDFSQSIVGNYLFKLSSPEGSVTISFAVTNYPYGQKFTGTVVSNGVAVPYAAVILFQGGGGNDLNPLGGAVANNSGVYTIKAPPGTYALTAFQSNFVADTGAAANLVLGSGATINTNLTLIAATQTISGSIVDTNNPAIGLPGIFLSVQSTNGLLGICYTDSNGNFITGVTSNQWKIEGQSGPLALHGYVGSQNKVQLNIASASVSGLTIALPKATALFYGTVTDTLGNPLPEVVEVEAYDNNSTNNNGEYRADGFTDTNGYYVAAAVGGLGSNDTWQVEIDNAGSFPNYNFSQPSFGQNGGTNLAAGVVVPANITALLATNFITGHVQFDGNPVVGVQVNAYSTDTNNFQSQSYTDGSGNYSLNVGNDNWSVNLYCQGDSGSLDSILGPGNYQCPCGANVTISNNNGTANITVTSGGGSGGIFGYVTNTGGGPIAGIFVDASGCNGDYYFTSTSNNGYYSFSGLANGGWNVSVSCNGLNTLGYDCVNDTNVTVSSGNVEVDFTVQSQPSPAYISGRVVDNLGNPVTNMNVLAIPQGGGSSFGATTDAGGNYQLGVSAGSYDVQMNTDPSTGAPSRGLVGPFLPENVTNGVNISNLVLVAQHVTGSIAASVTNTSGPFGVAGINLFASATLQGTNYSTGPQPTSSSGTVTIEVCNGNWFVSPDCNALGGDGYGCPDGQNVNISNNSGFANFTVTSSSSPLQVATTSLPGGTNGIYYSQTLQASGGQSPYYWSIPNYSANPPANLTLSSNGLLSGTPATNGAFYFYARVTDSASNTADSSVLELVVVSPGQQPLQITTVSLPNGAVGAPYSALLGVTGGQEPYHCWSLAEGSAGLPPGLSLSCGGLISGTPTNGGSFNFIVEATDADATAATKLLGILINFRPVLSLANWHTNQFQMRLTGASDQNYTLQASTNLSSTNWISLYITNNAQTNSFLVTDPNATNKQRFYRILVGP